MVFHTSLQQLVFGPPSPVTMAARSWSWLLLLCLAAAADCGVLKARAQPDSIGKRSTSRRRPLFRSYCVHGLCHKSTTTQSKAMQSNAPSTDPIRLSLAGFINIDCGMPGTSTLSRPICSTPRPRTSSSPQWGIHGTMFL
jgi:hypothetical protein